MLPQLHSQTATIKVNLKHKLQYKSSALSLNVRRDKVVQAAKIWLMSSSMLYKNEGIVLNEYWANTYVTEVAQLENDDNDMECNDNLSENLNNQNDSEDVQQIPAGVTDTLFTTDFLEDTE